MSVHAPQSKSTHPVSLILGPPSTKDLILVVYRYDMLHGSPMCIARVAVDLTEMLHGICDVRMGGSCGIHYGSYSSEVWDFLHLYFLLFTGRAEVLGQDNVWI